MKNYIQPGDTLTVPAPTGGVLSGGIVVIGSLLGVATTTAGVGIPVAIKTTGVFEFPKVSAQAWAVGDKVYYDAATGFATATVGSNALLGTVTEAAANPSAVGRVRLRGMYPG